jgi:hypothetical protein
LIWTIWKKINNSDGGGAWRLVGAARLSDAGSQRMLFVCRRADSRGGFVVEG